MLEWKPYCFEDKCKRKHEKSIPSHGSCCTCQVCGKGYDECICQYFKEPCLICPYRSLND